MVKKIKNFFYLGERFKKEFRRQLRSLIIIALGFTIAFTWRQTIFDLSESIVQFFTHIEDSAALSTLTSLFVTFAAVFLILLASYILKDPIRDY